MRKRTIQLNVDTLMGPLFIVLFYGPETLSSFKTTFLIFSFFFVLRSGSTFLVLYLDLYYCIRGRARSIICSLGFRGRSLV